MPENLMSEVLNLDPNDPTNTEPRQTLDLTNEADRADYHRLLLFLSYLGDRGIYAQLLTEVARDIYRFQPAGPAPKGSDAEKILKVAVADIENVETNMASLVLGVIGAFGAAFGIKPSTEETPAEETGANAEQAKPKPAYDLRKIADSAISLELLAFYAGKLSPLVFPPDCIPTREFVANCMRLFHLMKREAVAKKLAEETAAGSDDDNAPAIRMGVLLEETD